MTTGSSGIESSVGGLVGPRYKMHIRYSLPLLAFALIANAVPFFAYRPGDADFYLIPWYQHILAVGRIQVFAEPFSNYAPPYLYLLSGASILNRWVEPLIAIKLLACIGAIWMAYAVARLLQSLGCRFAVEGAMWIAGIALYMNALARNNRRPGWPFWSLVVVCTVMWAAGPFSPPPPDASALGWFGLLGWMIVPWAVWADRSTRPSSVLAAS